jgi:hypothetical protein
MCMNQIDIYSNMHRILLFLRNGRIRICIYIFILTTKDFLWNQPEINLIPLLMFSVYRWFQRIFLYYVYIIT